MKLTVSVCCGGVGGGGGVVLLVVVVNFGLNEMCNEVGSGAGESYGDDCGYAWSTRERLS